jgi:2-alkenal reductase
MNDAKTPSRFSLLIALLVMGLALLACGIPASGLGSTAEDSQEVVMLVVTATPEVQAVGGDTAASEPATSPPSVPVQTSPAVAAQMGDMEQTLVSLYERASPAVVHIFAYQDALPLGTGTGFVIDNDGHIVTNNHVVSSGTRFEVSFPGGFRTTAELIGTDVDSDLAVIQVADLPEGLQPLALGNSRDVRVGQFVIAIGNPFGQESSMSLGIISGLGRSLRSQRIAEGGGQYSLPQVLQTDAPINPGNSGGPLLNLAGQVVGVNTAISTETGTNSGVGYAIPVNAVQRIAPALIAEGQYTYPYLGVSVFDGLDLAAQEQLGLPQATGAYVTTVTPNSPAGVAGVRGAGGDNARGGDLIIAIDGQTVLSFSDLITYLVFETEVGQTVTLTILRGEEQIDLPVVLGARP